jgi:hypothetical protein
LISSRQVHFTRGRRSRKVIEPARRRNRRARGYDPAHLAPDGPGDPLRPADQGWRDRDQADLARLGNVSRARVTQIMNLLQLAPDIQEAILFLPRTVKGRDPIREKHVRPIAQ